MADDHGSTEHPVQAADDGGRERKTLRQYQTEVSREAKRYLTYAIAGGLLFLVLMAVFNLETLLLLMAGAATLFVRHLPRLEWHHRPRWFPDDRWAWPAIFWGLAAVLAAYGLLDLAAPGNQEPLTRWLPLELFIVLACWRFVEKSAIALGVAAVAVLWTGLRIVYGSGFWTLLGWGFGALPDALVWGVLLVALATAVYAVSANIEQWGRREVFVFGLLFLPFVLEQFASWADFSGTFSGLPADGSTCHDPVHFTCHVQDGWDGLTQAIRLAALLLTGWFVYRWRDDEPPEPADHDHRHHDGDEDHEPEPTGSEPHEHTEAEAVGIPEEPEQAEEPEYHYPEHRHELFQWLTERAVREPLWRKDGSGFRARTEHQAVREFPITAAELRSHASESREHVKREVASRLRDAHRDDPTKPLVTKNGRGFYADRLRDIFNSKRAPELITELGITPEDLKEPERTDEYYED